MEKINYKLKAGQCDVCGASIAVSVDDHVTHLSANQTTTLIRALGGVMPEDAPADPLTYENEALARLLLEECDGEPVQVTIGRNIILERVNDTEWLLRRRPYPYAELSRGTLAQALSAANAKLHPEPVEQGHCCGKPKD